ITKRSRWAFISRGRKRKSKSSLSSRGGFSSAPVSAVSGCVIVVNATRSPKFDFINSASFDFSSSGEGKGGFCSMVLKGKSNTRARPVNGDRCPDWRVCIKRTLARCKAMTPAQSGKTREFIVTSMDGRLRLDLFLVRHAPEFSRARIQGFIRNGLVKLNEATPRPSDTIRPGDHLVLIEPPVESLDLQAEGIVLSVLFEDNDLIVINKLA